MVENLWENKDVKQAFKPQDELYAELITMWKKQLFNLNFIFLKDGFWVLL